MGKLWLMLNRTLLMATLGRDCLSKKTLFMPLLWKNGATGHAYGQFNIWLALTITVTSNLFGQCDKELLIYTRCKGNLFSLPSPLKSLVSSALVPNNAKDDIFHFAEKGQKRFEDFINDRLLSTPIVWVWDPMKKLKLKTFSNLTG